MSYRPQQGVYIIRQPDAAGGWLSPSSNDDGNLCGAGPLQYLGAFDTRPELPEWSPDAHQQLALVNMPGGATLRWQSPRYLDPRTLTRFASFLPDWRYAACLTLYIASFDTMVQSDQNQPVWPGLIPGTAASDLKVATTLLPSETRWAGQLLAASPQGSAGSAGLGIGGDASLGPLLARTGATPALDLLAYARPGGWVEADLVRLGGGCRYVMAWLGFQWARWETVDWMAGLTNTFQVPWTVSAGRPADACHDEAWHVGFAAGVDATLGGAPGSQADMFTSPFATRRGLYSPIRGQWTVTYCVNSPAAAADVWFGLEQRGTDYQSRSSAAQTNMTHVNLQPARVHGGSAALAFWSSARPAAGGIVGVSVVKT